MKRTDAGLIAGLLVFAVVAVIVRVVPPPRGSMPPLVILGVLTMFILGSGAAERATEP